MVFYAVLVLALVSLLVAGLLAPAYAAESVRALPILMYHEIVPDGNELDEYTASVTQLEADLMALEKEGFQTVSLSEVIDFVRQGTALPLNPVLLVFDDGYRSVISRVLPLLEKYDAKALVSVIGARAQGVADGCDTSQEYMDWKELAEAVTGGRIELQSHSAQLHVYRSRKGLQRLADETQEAYIRMLVADVRLMDRWACKAGGAGAEGLRVSIWLCGTAGGRRFARPGIRGNHDQRAACQPAQPRPELPVPHGQV